MPSPHYPDVRLTTREAPSVEALIDKGRSLMRRRGIPIAERIAYTEALVNLDYDRALAEAQRWITVVTPSSLARWDLTKVRLRAGLERETLVLNPHTQFTGLGKIPTLHLRRCSSVLNSHGLKGFNASAKSTFESEKVRRAAGDWPSMSFCRRCLVEKIR